MAVESLVPRQDYLSSSYHPDCEYVDGRLIERNGGEYDHSFLQGSVFLALKSAGLRAYVELRLQTGPNRFRAPDVLALAPGQKRDDRYQQAPPYSVVEILSPEDTVGGVTEKLKDYFSLQIPNIRAVDPGERTLTVHALRETRTYTERVTTSDNFVSLDLQEIFRQLEDDEAE